MHLRKLTSVGVAVALLAAGVAMAAPASADPVAVGYAATGSDTLQDSMNALVNGTGVTGSVVRVTAAGNPLGSFDAFGSNNIQTKSNGPYFPRPGGSGAGVNALIASIKGTTYNNGTATSTSTIGGQVDIARSSSAPGSNASTSGLLEYIPFARDGVAYAYKAADAASATVLSSLTTAQLTAIYSATAPSTINGVTITPRLPQINSGTRKFFTGVIGVSNTAPGTAVPSTDNTAGGPAENDATVLGSNEIIPFSVASWIAQSNGAAPSTIGSTGVLIGSPNGVLPFTGTAPALVASSTFYATAFGRDTYLVVEYARVNPSDGKYDAALAALVDPTVAGSLTSYGTFKTTPGAVKTKFGFLAPSSSTPIRAYASI